MWHSLIWAGTCGTSAVPILENTCASSYEKHYQHLCMNSTYYLSLQYCSRVGRVRNVQPWFNSEDSWQIPKTHGWRPDNCQVLLCWVRPAQLQHMVEPSEPSVPEFFFSASKSKKIYIYKNPTSAPGSPMMGSNLQTNGPWCRSKVLQNH